jgi:MFS family permease
MRGADAGPNPHRWLLLALLLLSYIFNFLDRQIVSILQIPLKADLALSDTQLGLLGGTAFAIFYTTLAIPLAALADRKGRLKVVAAGVFGWSLFTALCGIARGFPALFAFRVGVGVGEAAGVAPSYALLSTAFPNRARARALAFYSLGIPFGSGLGIFLGGWLASVFDWRTAFIVVGLAGVPIALALWLFERSLPECLGHSPAKPPSLVGTARQLAAKPSFWLLSFGAAFSSICGYGFGQWIPRMIHDTQGTDLKVLGQYFGSVVVIGGSLGIVLGGILADRLGRSRMSAFALVPAAAFCCTLPLYAVAFGEPSLRAAWPFYTVAYGLSVLWLGPIVAGIQGLVKPSSRAMASSMFLLINNLIGIGAGPLLFGIASDHLTPTYGTGALKLALTYGLALYAVAMLLCFLAAFRLREDSQPEESWRP